MPREKPISRSIGARHLPLLCGAALLGVAFAVPVHAAQDSAAYDDTAHCIAVMQPNADELARQVKAGNKAQEPALRSELVRATALVGRTYLNGLHDSAEAKARLKAAQAQQSSWDNARKVQLHQACLQRADAELAAATPPERFIVDRVAQSTMQRMLRVQ